MRRFLDHRFARFRPELEQGHPASCAFGLVLRAVPRLRVRVGIDDRQSTLLRFVLFATATFMRVVAVVDKESLAK
jgi:hypothetical protein